jgi:hypothetical protein
MPTQYTPPSMPLIEEEKNRIYVDASQPATVQHAPGSFDCHTLQEAVLAWHRLPANDREHATIKVNVPDGPVYTAREIERLHYGPKPK